MAISNSHAELIFRAEAAAASGPETGEIKWLEKIEELSRLCEVGGSSTHIAFLGTSILARAVSSSIDLFAIKPRHSPDNPNAYSARTLCHTVLVPLAAELGVNLGVNGREPLNNQPYFRMSYLDDGTPIHSRAAPAFNYMLGLIKELQQGTSDSAKNALRAFVIIRKNYHTVYDKTENNISVDQVTLASAIHTLVSNNSEGGRRAQAAVAGLFDLFAGPDWVESGKINDPSRHYPGDVAIRTIDGGWEKSVEVRDKPVNESDIFIFGRTCQHKGVKEAAVVLASSNQRTLNGAEIRQWANNSGIGLNIFYGWNQLVNEALFWSSAPTAEAVGLVVEYIERRLISIQASNEAVRTWQTLTRA
ncbi:restriction endonuclease, SacI family [Pseudomonas veronii]|uniref:restriction endonuclease, SacI family n=1 Tax=Pseudomonas veronii TaxID=76761 RepID=UPI0026580A72|nr:restriction endonuclease, SacI family [Pseudomonas veronii]WKC49055.1 restriction endonuclease, SacI family [Pseudomonas veronii]